MNKEIKKKLILSFSNHHIEDVVELAYELKPYNGQAVESAKLINEWFKKEHECNFTKICERFLSYGEDKKNEFAPLCLYMAAKINLFYKKDVPEALRIVRKAYLQDEIFLGTSFLGYYIYQNGLVDGTPDYLLARQYLVDSINFDIPWFESFAVLEKKNINDRFKVHYAKNVVQYAENEELKAKSVAYLFSYYDRNNYLEELNNLYENIKDNFSLFFSSKEIIAASLYRLGTNYIAKKEYDKGIKCYKNSSFLGCEKASEQLGIAYYQGTIGVKKDINNALFYLNKLEKGGMGMLLLGLLYEKGEEVPQSMDKAFDIYLKCSKVNYPEAFFRLGKIYCDGTYKAKDEYLAHRYFEEYKERAKDIPLSRLKMIECYYDSFKR